MRDPVIITQRTLSRYTWRIKMKLVLLLCLIGIAAVVKLYTLTY